MKFLSLVFAGILLSSITFAQNKKQVESPSNCDAMLARFDNVSITASSEQNKDKLITVVAYLGRGEKSNGYNQRRLKALTTYLEKRGLSKERLILTEGKKRNGLAKLEFYIDGELIDELFLVKKGSVCTWCC